MTIQARISKSRGALRSDTLFVPNILDNGHSAYKVQRAHPFFCSPEVWRDLRVHWISLLILSQTLTPPVYPAGQRSSDSSLLMELQPRKLQWKDKQAPRGLCSVHLCSEPLRRGPQPCHTNLTTVETFSGRSFCQKRALGIAMFQ